MQVIGTMSDLNTALASGTVAQCGFERHAKDSMHAGHAAIITAANAAADISLATFYPHTDITNYLSKQNTAVPPWKPTDKNYCIDFCNTNGADIVFIPDISDIITAFHLQAVDVDALVTLVDGIITTNGYYHPAFNDSARYYVAFEYQRNLYSVYPKNYSVYSNKDGYAIYTRKHYLSTMGVQLIVVPKILRPDGLPYSDRLNGATTDDLAILKLMYDGLLALTYEEVVNLDIEAFRLVLNVFDTKPVKTVTVKPMVAESFPTIYKFVNNHLDNPTDVLIEVIVSINGTTEMLSNLWIGPELLPTDYTTGGIIVK